MLAAKTLSDLFYYIYQELQLYFEKLECQFAHLYSPKVSSFIGRASESTSLSSLSFTVGKKKAHGDPQVCTWGRVWSRVQRVVRLTCIFATLAAFDEAKDQQDQHQQNDGADESNQPALSCETAGQLRQH